MKEFTVYQWIVQDMQHMCMPKFILTDQYYPSKKECSIDFEISAPCFSVKSPLRRSKMTGSDAWQQWQETLKIRERVRGIREACRKKEK